jgi:predicted ABC-type ATPase
MKTNRKRKGRPRCLLIAGPNGVGKTTFASEYLPTDARIVQKTDVLRRFSRSWHNFQTVYRPLADAWAVYDNSSRPPKLIESGR